MGYHMQQQQDLPHHNILICFSGKSTIWSLCWLKPHYRHIFILMRSNDQQNWIYCEPLIPKLELDILPPDALQDLLMRLVAEDIRILPANRSTMPPNLSGLHFFYWHFIAPFRLYHCLQVALEILGRPKIMKSWLRPLTPYRLSRYLLTKLH